jgi:hypothetical protein
VHGEQFVNINFGKLFQLRTRGDSSLFLLFTNRSPCTFIPRAPLSLSCESVTPIYQYIYFYLIDMIIDTELYSPRGRVKSLRFPLVDRARAQQRKKWSFFK